MLFQLFLCPDRMGFGGRLVVLLEFSPPYCHSRCSLRGHIMGRFEDFRRAWLVFLIPLMNLPMGRLMAFLESLRAEESSGDTFAFAALSTNISLAFALW